MSRALEFVENRDPFAEFFRLNYAVTYNDDNDASSEPELLFSKKKVQGQIRKLIKGLLFEQSLNDKNFHLLENENQRSQFLHI